MTLLAWLSLGAVGLGLILVALNLTDPMGPAAPDPEDRIGKEFKAYVSRELHKAETGAANAAPWAQELLAEWKKHRHRR